MIATITKRAAPIITPTTIPTIAASESPSSSDPVPPGVVLTDGVTIEEVVGKIAEVEVINTLDITTISTA